MTAGQRPNPQPDRVERRRPGVGAAVLLAFALIAALQLSPVLIHPSRVLDFNDGNIESSLAPTYALPGALLRVWDNQFFFGIGGKQFALCTASIGEWIFGPHHYRREAIALILALVGGAVYWMLRQLEISRLPAALTGGAVMLSGAVFSFAVLGLAVRGAALGFAALALGFLERGRRSGRLLPYALAGGCLGLAIAETPDIGVFFALTLAAVFVWLHWPAEPRALRSWRPLAGRFALFVAASAALSLQTLSVMFATQIEGVQQGATESPEARYDWATQWSLPPNETWDLVAGTFYGASMRSAAAPYRGRIGRSPGWTPDQPQRGFRNFAMTGYHLGVIPSALLLAGWIALPAFDRERRRLAWLSLIGALVCLGLAWGRYTPLYRLVFSLPYLGTIRNPEKWLMPFMLFAASGIGLALDSLRRHAGSATSERGISLPTALVRASLLIAVVALLTLLATVLGQDAFRAGMAREGYAPPQIDAAWRTALRASLRVLLLSGGVAALTRLLARPSPWLPRPLATPAAAISALALAGALDLVLVNRHYVAGREYRHILEPNPLTAFVAQHRGDGRFKILPADHPALNYLRMSFLQTSGCDLFDPVSVSRLPTDYAALFDALQPHSFRLWSLGAVRYFVTLRGGPEQLEQLDGNRGRIRDIWGCGLAQHPDGTIRPVSAVPPDQQFLRIAEFAAARPKWFFPARLRIVTPDPIQSERATLEHLRAPDFDPLTESVVVSSNALPTAGSEARRLRVLRDEPTAADIEVETHSDALLVRAVRYDPDWRVTVDGRPAALLRADYIMQAVVVPAGRHRVVWDYRPSPAPLYAAIAGRVGWLVLWLLWRWPPRSAAPRPSPHPVRAAS